MGKIFIALLFLFCIVTAQAQKSGKAITISADTAKQPTDTAEIPPKYQNIHRRSPVLACVLSVYITGLGQIYNKQYLKGCILFSAFVLSFGAAEAYNTNGGPHANIGVSNNLFLLAIVTHIYSFIDAPMTASRLNREYHLGKHKHALSTLSISPGFINTGQGGYVCGVGLVLR